MPFKQWTLNELLTSPDVNDYLMEQAVIRCTSGSRPASPNEGMLIYETDTDQYMGYTGSGWEFLNKFGGWTAYTPAFTTSGGGGSLGTGATTWGAYKQIGKTVHAAGLVIFGTSPNFGTNNLNLSVPVTAANTTNSSWLGTAFLRDASGGTTGYHSAFCILGQGASVIAFIAASSTTQVTGTSPFTWAATDFIRFTITYEAA